MSKKEGKISREDFEAFKFGVERLKELQRELNSLDTRKFKSEANAIRVKLKDVSQIPAIERGIKVLKLKIENKYHPAKRKNSSSVAVSGLHDDLKDIKEDLEENLPAIRSAIKKLGKKVESFQNQNLSFKITSVNLKRKIRQKRKRKHQKKKAKIKREKIVREKIKKRKNRKNKIRRKKIKMQKIKKVAPVKRNKIVRKRKSVRKITAPVVKKRVRRHRKKISGAVKPAKKLIKKPNKDQEIKKKIIQILTHEKALSLKEIKKRLKKVGIKKSKHAIIKYIKMIENEGRIKEVK